MDADEKRQEVLASLYAELRRRAESFMADKPRNITLQPTALVHEACIKLNGHACLEAGDKTWILALASRAMRGILVDHARSKARLKRMPNGKRVPIDDLVAAYEQHTGGDLPSLDDALHKLGEFDPQMAEFVDLHFIAGLTIEEIATAWGVATRTLERRWRNTRIWLMGQIRREP